MPRGLPCASRRWSARWTIFLAMPDASLAGVAARQMARSARNTPLRARRWCAAGRCARVARLAGAAGIVMRFMKFWPGQTAWRSMCWRFATRPDALPAKRRNAGGPQTPFAAAHCRARKPFGRAAIRILQEHASPCRFPVASARRKWFLGEASPARSGTPGGGTHDQIRNDPRRHGRLDFRAVGKVLLSREAAQGPAASLRLAPGADHRGQRHLLFQLQGANLREMGKGGA